MKPNVKLAAAAISLALTIGCLYLVSRLMHYWLLFMSARPYNITRVF